VVAYLGAAAGTAAERVADVASFTALLTGLAWRGGAQPLDFE